MLTFTLAISCLTTSYLPWFMDLTFQVPRQYYSLQHWTLLPSPVTSTTGHCFLLWLHLFILPQVISQLFFSSIMGIYWPGEFIFQCHIILSFHTVHGVLMARKLKWFAIPFYQVEKHLLLFYSLHQSLWLCESQQTVENSSRPPYLPPKKSEFRSRSNS